MYVTEQWSVEVERGRWHGRPRWAGAKDGRRRRRRRLELTHAREQLTQRLGSPGGGRRTADFHALWDGDELLACSEGPSMAGVELGSGWTSQGRTSELASGSASDGDPGLALYCLSLRVRLAHRSHPTIRQLQRWLVGPPGSLPLMNQQSRPRRHRARDPASDPPHRQPRPLRPRNQRLAETSRGSLRHLLPRMTMQLKVARMSKRRSDWLRRVSSIRPPPDLPASIGHTIRSLYACLPRR